MLSNNGLLVYLREAHFSENHFSPLEIFRLAYAWLILPRV